VDIHDESSLDELENCMRNIKKLAETRPSYHPARVPVVLCRKIAPVEKTKRNKAANDDIEESSDEDDVAVTDSALSEFRKEHDWCELPTVLIDQWDEASVESGFQRLFSISNDLEVTFITEPPLPTTCNLFLVTLNR